MNPRNSLFDVLSKITVVILNRSQQVLKNRIL